MIIIRNINIRGLLSVLLKLNLSYDSMDFTVDEDNNKITITPVAPDKLIEGPKEDDVKITEEDIDNII